MLSRGIFHVAVPLFADAAARRAATKRVDLAENMLWLANTWILLPPPVLANICVQEQRAKRLRANALETAAAPKGRRVSTRKARRKRTRHAGRR